MIDTTPIALDPQTHAQLVGLFNRGHAEFNASTAQQEPRILLVTRKNIKVRNRLSRLVTTATTLYKQGYEQTLTVSVDPHNSNDLELRLAQHTFRLTMESTRLRDLAVICIRMFAGPECPTHAEEEGRDHAQAMDSLASMEGIVDTVPPEAGSPVEDDHNSKAEWSDEEEQFKPAIKISMRSKEDAVVADSATLKTFSLSLAPPKASSRSRGKQPSTTSDAVHASSEHTSSHRVGDEGNDRMSESDFFSNPKPEPSAASLAMLDDAGANALSTPASPADRVRQLGRSRTVSHFVDSSLPQGEAATRHSATDTSSCTNETMAVSPVTLLISEEVDAHLRGKSLLQYKVTGELCASLRSTYETVEFRFQLQNAHLIEWITPNVQYVKIVASDEYIVSLPGGMHSEELVSFPLLKYEVKSKWRPLFIFVNASIEECSPTEGRLYAAIEINPQSKIPLRNVKVDLDVSTAAGLQTCKPDAAGSWDPHQHRLSWGIPRLSREKPIECLAAVCGAEGISAAVRGCQMLVHFCGEGVTISGIEPKVQTGSLGQMVAKLDRRFAARHNVLFDPSNA
mmetsp:Transcript_74265/g.204586  ORF Transcript_74265/g.204586 Transcript_74265/m.204586 type:complete len:568 (+) Transcript_74265:848-2551(+)